MRPNDPAKRLAVLAFAWAGGALFVASLVYFLLAYGVTFGEKIPGSPTFLPIAIDLGLFSLFALHHSLFARTRVRAWMAKTFSPVLERSVYVWAASLMLIAVCALWWRVPGVVWEVDSPAKWVLYAAQIAGIWLALRSAAIIDVWDLAGIRQVSKPEGALQVSESAEFKTSGPYGWVRHPIYLGWFLIVFAVGTMTMTRFVFAVISSVYVLIAIPLEERSLRESTHDAYMRYVQRVRWKLVPGLY